MRKTKRLEQLDKLREAISAFQYEVMTTHNCSWRDAEELADKLDEAAANLRMDPHTEED